MNCKKIILTLTESEDGLLNMKIKFKPSVKSMEDSSLTRTLAAMLDGIGNAGREMSNPKVSGKKRS